MSRDGSALTENQLKVIGDKYLQDAPDVDAWLRGVAANVALAEVLLHPKAGAWGAFEGVSLRQEEVAGPEGLPPAALRLFHSGLTRSAERDENFQRLLRNLSRAAEADGEAKSLRDRWAGRFFALMRSWTFLPNSPTLMNAGRELQQLSACYVLPVEDSMDGINAALAAQSLIQKSGGGTGFSFSRLRPKGDPVKKTRGVASGAVSFMRLFDTMTAVIKQGGVRRGANMGVLHYTHPEIADFIALKSRPGLMENFNLSVGVDAAFMEAVAADGDVVLVNPRTGARAGSVPARRLFAAICENAWRTGDPGLVVLDRINASLSNPTPALGRIEATNPCGEQPLLPWEPCNLGSINLAELIEGEIGKGKLDAARLRGVVDDALRFLDDVIEINNYPLSEIEALAKGNRRVGLGVMGLAEALVKAGLAYDSPEALAFAEEAMRLVNEAALDCSRRLARERGAFPNWRGSAYDGRSPVPRHCARTTIAPTGTIALAAGLQGSGIEPFFGIGYRRYSAAGLEALKEGKTPAAECVYEEVNPLFRAFAEAHRHFGLTEHRLFEKIQSHGGSVRAVPEVPSSIARLFPTAHEVSVEYHVKMAAAFQRHTDNGVSKTINLPATATVLDVERAFKLAYAEGLKGITVYRDGSKAQQVLSLGAPSRRVESCPKCRSSNVSHESGCGGPTCHDCGYAECS